MTTDRELMQQALDALIWTTGSEDFSETGKARAGALKTLFPAIETLRARLAQPEPKPVAWRKKWEGENEWTYYWMERYQGSEALYTAPPQREWVGLTDEEKLTIVQETDNPVDALAATEAKLQAKNAC